MNVFTEIAGAYSAVSLVTMASAALVLIVTLSFRA